MDFAAARAFAVGSEPASAAAGDFNGDGHPDLAAANSYSGTVSVLLGKGDGTFQAAVGYAVGRYPTFVAVADLNGDGHVDLAVVNSDSGTVSILLGNPDGTFREALGYGTGSDTASWPSSLAVADFNEDAHPDLAVANRESHSVSILLGNGNGSFQAPVNHDLGPYVSPFSVVVGDFDEDNHTDIVVASSTTTTQLSILRGLGNGSFGAPAVVPQAPLTSSVEVGDFDRDGHLDLAITTSGYLYGVVSIVRGQGDGTFAAAQGYTAGMTPGSGVAADFDGDGGLDIVVGNYQAGTVSILRGNGDGTLQAAVSYVAGGLVVSVAVGDFDRDGHPDLAVVGRGNPSGTISILRGKGDGTFHIAPTYSVGAAAHSVAAGDFDEDGHPDLAVVEGSSDSVSVLLGNGDGTFQAAVSHAAGVFPLGLAAGDLDGDGHADLAVTNYISQAVLILRGNGDGTFQAAVSYGVGDLPISVALGDFNGDGHSDLAVANAGSDSVSILRGNGDGTFLAEVNYAVAGGAGFVTLGDFDEDGYLDLTVATANGVSVLRGNGDGTFQAATNHPVWGGASSAAVGDFDGDGHPDLAVATQTSDNVSILLGNGDGTFRAAVTYAVGSGGLSAAVGDFNGDGYPDVTVATGNGISFLLGRGDGTFQGAVTYAEGTLLVVRDFDGDGYLDAAATIGSEVAILLNTSCLRTDIADVAMLEGESGLTDMVFTATFSRPASFEIQVEYATSNGTARAGADYVTTSGRLTFAPGDTSATLAVPVVGDVLPGLRETFFVDLMTAFGAAIGRGRAVGTVENDDTGTLRISSVTAAEGRRGITPFVFTVTLTPPSDGGVTVRYTTQEGSARAGGDFLRSSGILTFAQGETTKTIMVPVVGDRIREPAEAFYVRLFNATGAPIGTGLGRGVILNDD